MNVVGIESVVYGVSDLPLCERFWADFGLEKREKLESGASFATAEGATIVLRDMNDPALPDAPIDGPTVREVIWGVGSAEALDTIATELARDRHVDCDADGTVHSRDGGGYAVGFRVSSVKPVSAEPTRYNAAGARNRIDQRAASYDKAAPVHLGHVVFRAPKPEEMRDFYIERLGFRLTDSYPNRGYFLRGGGSSDHHNLFAFNPDGTMGFHHVAFEMRDIHEVFGGGLHMTSKGWETHLGPGRHPVSSAYFWYFRNPCGGAAEYDFDSDICTDSWQPREFEPTPESFAEWALERGIDRYRGVQTARA